MAIEPVQSIRQAGPRKPETVYFEAALRSPALLTRQFEIVRMNYKMTVKGAVKPRPTFQ